MLFYRQINPLNIWWGTVKRIYLIYLFNASCFVWYSSIWLFPFLLFPITTLFKSHKSQSSKFYLLNRYWVALAVRKCAKHWSMGITLIRFQCIWLLNNSQERVLFFTSYFRPVIFMENELKPVPDSTHMYLNPCRNIRGHLFTLSHCTGGWGVRREVVMRHPHRQDGELPSASLGPCRGQGEQETGCRSDAGEAARAAQLPHFWHRVAELTAKTTQMEVHDLEGPLQSQKGFYLPDCNGS